MVQVRRHRARPELLLRDVHRAHDGVPQLLYHHHPGVHPHGRAHLGRVGQHVTEKRRRTVPRVHAHCATNNHPSIRPCPSIPSMHPGRVRHQLVDLRGARLVVGLGQVRDVDGVGDPGDHHRRLRRPLPHDPDGALLPDRRDDRRRLDLRLLAWHDLHQRRQHAGVRALPCPAARARAGEAPLSSAPNDGPKRWAHWVRRVRWCGCRLVGWQVHSAK